MTTIDVMILTYNRASLFRKTLISVCDQTYQYFTIKIYNNGSTDNTREVYEQVKAQYPNRKFEYFETKENRLGDAYLQNRNKLITADYCVIFHDDDLMHPNYIEYAMQILNKYDDIALIGCCAKVSKYPERLKYNTPTSEYCVGSAADMLMWHMSFNNFPFPSIVYRSKFLKETQFDTKRYGNRGDLPFLIDIAIKGKFYLLTTRFIHYRIHDEQDTFRLPTMQQRLNEVKKYASILLNDQKNHEAAFSSRILYYIQNNYISYLQLKKNNLTTPKVDRKYNLYKIKLIFFKILSGLTIGKLKQKTKKKQKHYLKKLINTSSFIPYRKDIFKNAVFTDELNYQKIKSTISGEGNIIDTNHINLSYKAIINIRIIGNNNYIFLENCIIANDLNIT